MSRLITVVTCAVLVAAVAVSVAVADNHGYGGKQTKQPVAKQQAVAKSGAKWKQFKDLEESQIALTAYMTGKAEVDDEGQDGAGDPGARGTATFFVADRQTLCYGFAVRGAEAPTLMHIHRGVAGSNGDPVIDFSKGVPKDANGQPAGDPGASSGCKVLEGAEKEALGRLLTNPRRYYVNMHTASFPKGAVRGQLSRMLFDND
jgi:CHRD domain